MQRNWFLCDIMDTGFGLVILFFVFSIPKFVCQKILVYVKIHSRNAFMLWLLHNGNVLLLCEGMHLDAQRKQFFIMQYTRKTCFHGVRRHDLLMEYHFRCTSRAHSWRNGRETRLECAHCIMDFEKKNNKHNMRIKRRSENGGGNSKALGLMEDDAWSWVSFSLLLFPLSLYYVVVLWCHALFSVFL